MTYKGELSMFVKFTFKNLNYRNLGLKDNRLLITVPCIYTNITIINCYSNITKVKLCILGMQHDQCICQNMLFIQKVARLIFIIITVILQVSYYIYKLPGK